MATGINNLDALSTDELLRLYCDTSGPGGAIYKRAYRRRLVQERDAEIGALADDAQVDLGLAANFLETSSTALLPWIYKGRLTGTKQPRGARGFLWTVPAGELRRWRVDPKVDARIRRDRAWMYETEGEALAVTAPTESISAGEFVRMFGSDPAADARKAKEKHRRFLNRLKVESERDDDEEGA